MIMSHAPRVLVNMAVIFSLQFISIITDFPYDQSFIDDRAVLTASKDTLHTARYAEIV